jgi:hypothetical protein
MISNEHHIRSLFASSCYLFLSFWWCSIRIAMSVALTKHELLTQKKEKTMKKILQRMTSTFTWKAQKNFKCINARYPYKENAIWNQLQRQITKSDLLSNQMIQHLSRLECKDGNNKSNVWPMSWITVQTSDLIV